MNKTSGTSKDAADKLVRGIKRKTRKHYSAEEKIRIVLAGLRGEESISALCRREGIAESLYYSWSKEFLEAGKARLSVELDPAYVDVAVRRWEAFTGAAAVLEDDGRSFAQAAAERAPVAEDAA